MRIVTSCGIGKTGLAESEMNFSGKAGSKYLLPEVSCSTLMTALINAVTRKTEIHPMTGIRQNLPKSAEKRFQSASHYCHFI